MAQALARRRARTITTLGAVAGGVALTTAAVAGWQAWLGTGPLVGLAVLPVTGVALAAQLVVHRGERLAASIGTVAGVLLVAALDGMQAASAVGLSLAIAIPAGAAGVVLRRYARGRFSLTTLRDLAVLTLVAALVAVTGAALAWAAVAIDTSIVDPWATLARYTLAETLGALVVVPAVLAWLTPAGCDGTQASSSKRRPSRWPWSEAGSRPSGRPTPPSLRSSSCPCCGERSDSVCGEPPRVHSPSSRSRSGRPLGDTVPSPS